MARRTQASISRNLRESREGLTAAEIEAAVCNYFCLGLSPSQICKKLANRVWLSREQPYRILASAASRGTGLERRDIETQIVRDLSCGLGHGEPSYGQQYGDSGVHGEIISQSERRATSVCYERFGAVQ